jgi:hypothetical protein
MLDRCQFDYDRFSIEESEKILYDSILQWLQRDSSEQIVEKFRYLFIKGNGCDCPQARAALEAIVNSENASREFNFVFNRCCHLIINEWHINPRLRVKIPLLINQIALALPLNSTQSRTTRKLRGLVLSFQESEQYLKLKRLSNLIDRSQENRPIYKQQAISNLIQRYPYLHQQCLLGEDSSYEFKQTITNLQKGIQHRYELDLSRYITYRVRLVEIVRRYKANKQTKIPKNIIQPVKNPTLLSDRDLDRGLRQYLGVRENGYTYHNFALKFRDNFAYINSHKELKQSFYEYLTVGFNCQYSKEVLNPKIFSYLDSILPDVHANKVDEFTLLRTCSLLLKFFVVDSIHNLNHYLFVDLIANLGEIKIIGLLLKIILLCDKAKPYLEQRFAILFAYYEPFTQDGVSWLINSLENLQLALSVHFGKVDLSLVKII